MSAARHVQRRLCTCPRHPGCPHDRMCPSFASRGDGHCPPCGNRRDTAIARGRQVLLTRRPQDALEDR